MARRAVVQQEEVFDAAEKLAADGKEVSALAVLSALGGGSLTTIYKHLSAWEASRPAVVSAGNNEVPEVVQNAFNSTWRVAAMEAAREVVAVRDKAAEDVRTAHKQFEGALDVIQKLESELDSAGAEIEGQRVRIGDLEAQVNETAKQNAALDATAIQLKEQVASLQNELERQHKEQATMRASYNEQLSMLTADHLAAVKEAAQMKGQADALKSQNSELIAKLGDKRK